MTDTGIGIAAIDHERVFEKFARLGGPQYAGTGLGLAISRELARLHGGDVTVESTLGLGSRFCLRLPRRIAPRTAVGTPVSTSPPAVGPGRDPMSEPLPLVLVVDDTPETRRLMRRVLERDRLRVAEAGTGEEALERIVALRPAAVVLDLRLPAMSGFEVARRVRAHPDPEVARTVLLACSASLQTEVIEAALEAGCDAFEGKPFDVSTFAGRVRGVMDEGRRERADAQAGVAPAD